VATAFGVSGAWFVTYHLSLVTQLLLLNPATLDVVLNPGVISILQHCCNLTHRLCRIEQQLNIVYYDLATRYICGGNLHPDLDTTCTFRRENSHAYSEAFTQLLCIASEVKAISKVGTVSVDGTKVKVAANT